MSRLLAWIAGGLLCLIHEPNEEVRVLGAVDLREEVGMGMVLKPILPLPLPLAMRLHL
jgi:hypothetical protein